MDLDVREETKGPPQRDLHPRVSIIIPSYNHERFVGRAVESVLTQTYQDFEIVITDDASTDGSVDILSSYARQDPRIKLFVNRFNYETHAVNHCIQQSSGEYIGILSSDDEFYPAKLEQQVDFLDRHPEVAAVFTQVRIVDEQNRDFADASHPYNAIFQQPNRSRHAWLRRFYFEGNCLCHPSVLVRRSVYETLGVYNPLMGALDDLDMWVRVCLRHEIHILGDTLVNFRIRDAQANVSADTPENFRRTQFETIKILDHFVSSDALAQLHLIFPEFADELAGASDAVKRHVLADAALATEQLAHRFWGIDSLYRLLSQPDTRRQLSHRISCAPDVDFVKLNGALNPLSTEHRSAAQIFWPDAGSYSEINSRSQYCPRSEWTELTFHLPAWDTAVPLRFDPCDCPGVIKIAALRILSQADGQSVWSSSLEERWDTLTVTGTALRLSDTNGCSILSTGRDPQLLLRGIPPLPDLPLELRVWIKLDLGLESAAREIESLRTAAVDREAALREVQSRLGALQTEHQRERGTLTAARNELQALAAAGSDRAAALEAGVAERDRDIAGLRAAVAERDRDIARLSAAGAERDRDMARLSAAGKERDRDVARLSAAVAVRDRSTAVIVGSRSWRYTAFLRALRRLGPPKRVKP
jgi:hypothetical protein